MTGTAKSMTWSHGVVLVIGLMLLTQAAWAQFVPEITGTASTLARGDAGVATTNEEATGAINPAALPLLFAMPTEVTSSSSQSASRPATPFLSQPGDAEIRLAYSATPGLAATDGLQLALDIAENQIMIESRISVVDQEFLRGLGVPARAWGHLAGATLGLNSDDNNDFFASHYSGGPFGKGWGLGAGYTNTQDCDYTYLAGGAVVARPGNKSLLTAGLKINFNGIEPSPEHVTMDLSALMVLTPAQILGTPARVTIGGRLIDLMNEYSIFPDAGRRLDLGVAVSTRNARVMLDLVDVFDGTGFQNADHSGRRVNIGGEYALVKNPSVIVMAGLADGRLSFGARGKIPVLGDIPYLGWAVGHREGDTRAELVVFLTPRITQRDE